MEQMSTAAQPAPDRIVRHAGRAGWQMAETDQLFSAVRTAAAEGKPLRTVFEDLAANLGRKPNSIRNYYYARLRQQPEAAVRAPAFQPFTAEETHQLLRQVLMARGQGVSVRACVMAMAQGSHSRMLRYQNKYRAILKNRPELVAQVTEELRREGLPCPEAPSVRTPRADQADAAFCDPEDAAAARLMAQPCVHHMLEGLKELLRRAARAEATPTPDEALQARCAELQQKADRLQVQFDLQRIAWEKDFDDCREHLRNVMTLLRDYTAQDAGSDRLADALAALRNAAGFLERQQPTAH